MLFEELLPRFSERGRHGGWKKETWYRLGWAGLGLVGNLQWVSYYGIIHATCIIGWGMYSTVWLALDSA